MRNRLPIVETLLSRHDAIGWDLDGTLVDGENAEVFAHYIRANPEKSHYVITFRDTRMNRHLQGELADVGLTLQHFRSIWCCPPTLYRAYHDSLFGPVNEVEKFWAKEYTFWKGKTAKAIGCSVLVDDMLELVRHGCAEHGIELIDAVALKNIA